MSEIRWPTKESITIEYNENIAEFWAPAGDNPIWAQASSMSWKKHAGKPAEKEREDFLRAVFLEYSNDVNSRIIFCDDEWKPLEFITEYWKTQGLCHTCGAVMSKRKREVRENLCHKCYAEKEETLLAEKKVRKWSDRNKGDFPAVWASGKNKSKLKLLRPDRDHRYLPGELAVSRTKEPADKSLTALTFSPGEEITLFSNYIFCRKIDISMYRNNDSGRQEISCTRHQKAGSLLFTSPNEPGEYLVETHLTFRKFGGQAITIFPWILIVQDCR